MERPPYELPHPPLAPVDQEYGTGTLICIVSLLAGMVGAGIGCGLTIAAFTARGWLA